MTQLIWANCLSRTTKYGFRKRWNDTFLTCKSFWIETSMLSWKFVELINFTNYRTSPAWKKICQRFIRVSLVFRFVHFQSWKYRILLVVRRKHFVSRKMQRRKWSADSCKSDPSVRRDRMSAWETDEWKQGNWSTTFALIYVIKRCNFHTIPNIHPRVCIWKLDCLSLTPFYVNITFLCASITAATINFLLWGNQNFLMLKYMEIIQRKLYNFLTLFLL